MLAFMGPSPERLRKVEVVHPWLYTPPAFLIPMPEMLPNNVDAVIKPFQSWVSKKSVVRTSFTDLRQILTLRRTLRHFFRFLTFIR
jgi:hypothetical protein